MMKDTDRATENKSSLDERTSSLKAAFHQQFGFPATFLSRAPGRVNLIGEHTDYNEGFVFPCAIDREMLVAARPRQDNSVRVYSLDYNDEDFFSLDGIESLEKLEVKSREWSNYLRGVVKTLSADGHRICGFDAVLSGNVPQGAGLSSSAAFEVAVSTLLKEMFNLPLTAGQIALLSQKAENQFVGVNCGIMDQFISALAVADSALLIDCRSLQSYPVPLNLKELGLSIVITNSGVQRALCDSQYNTRRRQCQQGVDSLSHRLGTAPKSLRDISLSQLQKHCHGMDELILRRCRHVITENERVQGAVALLEHQDLKGFGELMNESHRSLRDDYDVSVEEVDTLVDLTQKHPGVLGARMTGAGFGGCAVAIMKAETVGSFQTSVVPEYETRTGRKATVYICQAVSGAGLL